MSDIQITNYLAKVRSQLTAIIEKKIIPQLNEKRLQRLLDYFKASSIVAGQINDPVKLQELSQEYAQGFHLKRDYSKLALARIYNLARSELLEIPDLPSANCRLKKLNLILLEDLRNNLASEKFLNSKENRDLPLENAAARFMNEKLQNYQLLKDKPYLANAMEMSVWAIKFEIKRVLAEQNMLPIKLGLLHPSSKQGQTWAREELEKEEREQRLVDYLQGKLRQKWQGAIKVNLTGQQGEAHTGPQVYDLLLRERLSSLK